MPPFFRYGFYGFLSLLPLVPASAQADDYLSLGVGAFDILQKDNQATAFRAEYRWDKPLFYDVVKPFVGIEGTSDRAGQILGGFWFDVPLSDRVFFTPNIAASYYAKGSGKDLGFPIEFRSQFEVAYQFDNSDRVSVGFSHTSNASLGDDNPGQETLALYYHVPVGW